MLGYKIDFSRSPDESAERFYSDLTPVPKGADGTAQRELEEYRRRQGTEGDGSISKQAHSELLEQVSKVMSRFPSLAYSLTDDIQR